METIDINKIFKLDAYLATNIDWSKYTLLEIKAIANLYSGINPEWSHLNNITFSAKEFRAMLGISRNLSVGDIISMFENIKSVTQKILVDPAYNLNEEELKELNKNIDSCDITGDKQLFPKELIILSLIGSVSIELNQDNSEYEVRAKKIEIGFDNHIKRHLLFAKNAIKDENGKIIAGVNQYFDCDVDKINAFKNIYALRLFLSLFPYNNVSKTYKFDEFCNVIGLKTQRANFKTELKSRNSNGVKIDKTLKKYYNFKSRTLDTILEEIYNCTGLRLSVQDVIVKGKNGEINISIKFDIPNYRETRLKQKNIIDPNNGDDSNGVDNPDNRDDSNGADNSNNGDSSIGIDNLNNGDGSNKTEDLTNNNNAQANNKSYSNIDWGTVFVDNFGFETDDDKTNNLTDEDKVHIANLALIHNLEESEVQSLYIENNKNPQEVNKILSNEKI